MRTIWLCSMVMIANACADEGSEPSPFTVHDSSGITIAESSTPAWGDDHRFRVAQEPSVSIGALDGSDAFAFQRIRGVLRLSDGRIVVANGGSQEVRYFADDGSHLMTSGGPGGGPGEFQGLSALFRLSGDSLLVHDGISGRFTVLDPDGRTASTQGTEAPPTVIGRFTDGTVVYTGYSSMEAGAVEDGYVRPEIAIMRSRAEVEGPDTIARIRGAGEYRVEDQARVFTFAAPFTRPQIALVTENRVYAVVGDDDEIAVYDASGDLVELIRAAPDRRPITPADIEAYRVATREGYTEPSVRRDLHETVLEEAPYPSQIPKFSDLRVDAEGYTWAELYRLPGAAERQWRVLSPRGEWLGDVTTPAGFEVFDIGSEYLVGVWTDDLGIEYVHLYDLER